MLKDFMKNNVLFITEKWCEGNPNMGFSHTLPEIFNTFSHTQPYAKFNTIHIDECSLIYKKDINEILPQYCLSWDINVVFVSLLGDSPVNPSVETFQKLKQLGIFIAFIWCDSNPTELNLMEKYRLVSDLNISLDAAYTPNRVMGSQDIILWTPLDPNLYYPETKTRDISFMGRLYPYRQHLIFELLKKYPDTWIDSGQRGRRLTFEEYAKITRESKIIVNFSYHPIGYHQVKGRVFETTSTNSLLIESKNPATDKLFIPGKEYIDFTTPHELLIQVEHYLNNEQERSSIANNGYIRYQKDYNIHVFWEKIMDKVNAFLSSNA